MAEMIEQTDFQILDWIQANLRNPWLDWIMPKISFLCNGGWFWIALAVLCLIWKKHRRCGFNKSGYHVRNAFQDGKGRFDPVCP